MINYHMELEQGSPEWLAARCGLLTASEMKLILTPTGRIADNDKCRAHMWELMAQRITGYVEPHYISDDMLRGKMDEILARELYEQNYGEVDEVGFVTEDKWGFTLGYSPDGLVGMDGLIEIKSRRQRFQAETIASLEMPSDYMLQIQTGLLVTGRKWCDFLSYCGGMHMIVLRILPDLDIQESIIKAAAAFEAKMEDKLEQYQRSLRSHVRLIPTERVVEQEMV